MKKTSKHSKLFQWQERARSGLEECAKCREKRFITVEHIIPVHILANFIVGDFFREYQLEWEENFEFLCKWCNAEKGSRIDPRHPKTLTLMRFLLDRVEKEINHET